MATLDIKYDCNPTDGTPGEKFERFEIDAMNDITVTVGWVGYRSRRGRGPGTTV